ncbi:MAG: DUF4956 domain-containing protein [candidate division Zixibacteria bacterium]|nr:DUF4956 domain-containing protein [candidate division Zixibacteria bacterium]
MFEIFGLKEFFDTDDYIKLVMRLLLNLGFAWLVIRGIHYRLYRNRDMAFTYLLFNVITFALCFLLRKVPIELGFALGLFAVFGILRYRTEPIRTRDLTYLFVVIGLAILNAVANKNISLAELLTINMAIVFLTWSTAYSPAGEREETHNVVYDNLDLLKPDKREDLFADLTKRTGMEVTWVEVGDLNLLRDTAKLTISCHSQRKINHVSSFSTINESPAEHKEKK